MAYSNWGATRMFGGICNRQHIRRIDQAHTSGIAVAAFASGRRDLANGISWIRRWDSQAFRRLERRHAGTIEVGMGVTATQAAAARQGHRQQ